MVAGFWNGRDCEDYELESVTMNEGVFRVEFRDLIDATSCNLSGHSYGFSLAVDAADWLRADVFEVWRTPCHDRDWCLVRRRRVDARGRAGTPRACTADVPPGPLDYGGPDLDEVVASHKGGELDWDLDQRGDELMDAWSRLELERPRAHVRLPSDPQRWALDPFIDPGLNSLVYPFPADSEIAHRIVAVAGASGLCFDATVGYVCPAEFGCPPEWPTGNETRPSSGPATTPSS